MRACIKENAVLVGLSSVCILSIPLNRSHRVEPFIYRRVVLWKPNMITLFCRTVQAVQEQSTKKTIQFFASNVKILIVASATTGPIGAIIIMLKSLQNLQTLVIWDWHATLHEAIAASHPALTRLSLTRTRPLPAQRHFTHPMFQNVTHLEIVWRYPECWEGWKWESLQQLEHLTHFALNLISNFLDKISPNGLVDLVKGVISNCPGTVRVLILWVPRYAFFQRPFRDARTFEHVCKIDDRGRVVVGCFIAHPEEEHGGVPDDVPIKRSFEENLYDWAGVSTGKSFWNLAEDEISERRAWAPTRARGMV